MLFFRKILRTYLMDGSLHGSGNTKVGNGKETLSTQNLFLIRFCLVKYLMPFL